MKKAQQPRLFGARLALGLAPALFASVCFAQNPQAPAQGPAVSAPAPEKKAAPRGLSNFGEVTPTLFRGGQPSRKGYAELKKLGISTVVTFRTEHLLNAHEQAAVEAQGMHFISIPWSQFGKPSSAKVIEFFQLLRTHPDQKIYVHCIRGSDRTGVMIAAYRIALENWPPEKALQEMYAYHFWRHLFPQLTAYVKDFPKLLDEDPALRAALLAPPTSVQQ